MESSYYKWASDRNPNPPQSEFWRLAPTMRFLKRADWRIAPRALTASAVAPLGRIGRWMESDGHVDVLLEMSEPAARIMLTVFGSDNDRLTAIVGAATADVIDAAWAKIREALPRVTVTTDEVEGDFWYWTANGPQSARRTLAVPTWDEISGNYGASARDEVERVMRGWKPGVGGNLILWHGGPGTGKTYALRALAREWRDWCRLSYITDPDEFFGKAGYMIPTLLRSGGGEMPQSMGGQPEPQWSLVVLEDCGEMLTPDAKERVGAALGRLLNLTDGLIGQGLRVLVLITTNEDQGKLHEAVTRPGRCASQVRFEALGADEAEAWRERHGIFRQPGVRQGRTLAQLYAEGMDTGTQPERQTVGFVPR